MPLDRRFKLLALKFLLKLFNNFIDFLELIEPLSFKINVPDSNTNPYFTYPIFQLPLFIFFLYFDVSRE